MSHSVRLFVRRGQKLDLHIEEAPEFDCSLKIEPQPGAHDRLAVDLSVFRRGAGVNGEQQPDDIVVDAASGEGVGEDHGNIVGISNQSGFHQQASQFFGNVKNYASNQAGAALGNLAYPKAKESSGGDK